MLDRVIRAMNRSLSEPSPQRRASPAPRAPRPPRCGPPFPTDIPSSKESVGGRGGEGCSKGAGWSYRLSVYPHLIGAFGATVPRTVPNLDSAGFGLPGFGGVRIGCVWFGCVRFGSVQLGSALLASYCCGRRNSACLPLGQQQCHVPPYWVLLFGKCIVLLPGATSFLSRFIPFQLFPRLGRLRARVRGAQTARSGGPGLPGGRQPAPLLSPAVRPTLRAAGLGPVTAGSVQSAR